MQGQPRRNLHVALVQFEPALEVEPHYSDYILYFKGVAEVWVPYIAPGGEGEFAFLEVETRVRQLVKIADVIVVQVRQNDISDRVRLDIELPQTVDRTAQERAFPASRGFGGEAGVDQEHALRPDDHPGKVVHRHGTVVRVAADKMVSAPRVAGRILDGENFVVRDLLGHIQSPDWLGLGRGPPRTGENLRVHPSTSSGRTVRC